MVDFRKIISPRSQREIAQVHAALEEFASLDDTAMAAALVGMTRRLIDGGHFNSDPLYSYDEWALNRVIPTVARRLDPGLVLRPNEIPRAEEAADRLTWVMDMTDERLAECVDSILSHASFRRARTDAFDLDYEMISSQRKLNPISVAAGRALACVEPVIFVQEEEKPVLTGFYVIVSREHRGHVIDYVEDRALADGLIEHAVALQATAPGKAADDLVRAFRKKFSDVDHQLRFGKRMLHELPGILSFSVQTFEGEVLLFAEAAKKHEPTAGPDMF